MNSEACNLVKRRFLFLLVTSVVAWMDSCFTFPLCLWCMEKAGTVGQGCCWSCCSSPGRARSPVVSCLSHPEVPSPCAWTDADAAWPRAGLVGTTRLIWPGEAGGVRLLGRFSVSRVRAQFRAPRGLDVLSPGAVFPCGRMCSPDRSRYPGADPWAAGLGWPPFPRPHVGIGSTWKWAKALYTVSTFKNSCRICTVCWGAFS